MAVSQICFLHIAAKSRSGCSRLVRGLSQFFSASKCPAMKQLRAEQKTNSGSLLPENLDFCLSYTKSMSLLKKVRTKVPQSGSTLVFQNPPSSVLFGPPCKTTFRTYPFSLFLRWWSQLPMSHFGYLPSPSPRSLFRIFDYTRSKSFPKCGQNHPKWWTCLKFEFRT